MTALISTFLSLGDELAGLWPVLVVLVVLAVATAPGWAALRETR